MEIRQFQEMLESAMSQTQCFEKRHKIDRRHINALQDKAHYLELSSQIKPAPDGSLSLKCAQTQRSLAAVKLNLELARRIAAFIKLRHGCMTEAWEASSTSYVALNSEYARECSRNADLQTELIAVEEELNKSHQACSGEYVRASVLKGQVLQQQVHIRGLEHQLLGMRQSQQEALAEHAASLSTVEAELLAARAHATLQEEKSGVAAQRVLAAEELAAIAQDKLMQRAGLDSERLEFADDRAAEWVRIYKERVAGVEERVALLREELAASRLHLAAEQDRRTAGEARLAATADQEVQALRAQLAASCAQIAAKDHRVAALEDACRAVQLRHSPQRPVAAVAGLVSNSNSQLPARAEPALQAASRVAAGFETALPPIVESPAVSEDALAAPPPVAQPAKAHKTVSAEVPAKDDAKRNKTRKSSGPAESRKCAASTATAAEAKAGSVGQGLPKAKVSKRSREAAAVQNGTSESEADGAPAAAKRARRRSAGHEPVNIAEERAEEGEAPQAVGGRVKRQRTKAVPYWNTGAQAAQDAAPASTFVPNYREVSESPTVHVVADAPSRVLSAAQDARGAPQAAAAAAEAGPPELSSHEGIRATTSGQVEHTAGQEGAMPGDGPSSDQGQEHDAEAVECAEVDVRHAVEAPRHDATAAAAAAGRAAARQAARTKKPVKELQRPQGVAKIDLSTVWGGAGSPSLSGPAAAAPHPAAAAGVQAAQAGPSRLGNAPSGAPSGALPGSTCVGQAQGQRVGGELAALNPLAALNARVLEEASARPENMGVNRLAAYKKAWAHSNNDAAKRKLGGKPSGGAHGGHAFPDDLLFGGGFQIPKLANKP